MRNFSNLVSPAVFSLAPQRAGESAFSRPWALKLSRNGTAFGSVAAARIRPPAQRARPWPHNSRVSVFSWFASGARGQTREMLKPEQAKESVGIVEKHVRISVRSSRFTRSAWPLPDPPAGRGSLGSERVRWH